jgi:hypothetical protein
VAAAIAIHGRPIQAIKPQENGGFLATGYIREREVPSFDDDPMKAKCAAQYRAVFE